MPLILSSINIILTLEWELQNNKETLYMQPKSILGSLFLSEIFHLIAMSSRKSKFSGNIAIWLYISARLYLRYNYFDNHILGTSVIQIVISD